MKKIYTYLLLIVLTCVHSVAFSQAGALDESFNGTGHRTLNTNGYGNARAVATAPDGKILVAGNKNDNNGNYSDFSVVRLNSDGSTDNSFGNGGTVNINPSDYYYYSGSVYDVKVQADGKIVLCGAATQNNGYQGFVVVRLNADGSMDNSFGTNGKVNFGFNDQYNNYYNSYSVAQSLEIDTDGKIVVGGYAQQYYNYYYGNSYWTYFYAAARLNTDGSFDDSFGTNGKTLYSFPSNNNNYNYSYCYDVAIASDHSVVLVGMVYDYYNNNYGYDSYGFGVVKLTAAGQVDNSFGNSGSRIMHYNPQNYYYYNYSYARAVAVQNDGKIVVSGHVYAPYESNNANITTYYKFAVLRLNEDGSNDQSFANGTFATVSVIPQTQNDYNYGGYNYSLATDMVIQDNGKIILGGYAEGNQNNYNGNTYYVNAAFARYNTDGTLDATFGNNGTASHDISEGTYNRYSYIEKIAKQSDGKIVGAGWSYNANNQQNMAVLRIFANNDCPQQKVVGLPAGICNGIIVNDLASHFELYNGEQVVSVAYTVTGATEAAGNGDVSGTFFNKGISTVTYTAQIQTTENTTFSRSCSFIVNVKDVTAPVINCSATITVGMNMYDWAIWGDDLQLVPPTGSDDCGPVTFTNDAAGRWFWEGQNTVTWTATDAAGNTTTCTQTVNVSRDNVAPELTCPENIVVNASNGCGANVNFTANATDNGGTANISYSIQPGSYFPVGTTNVTVTATDNNNNSTQCSFTVTVADVAPVVITKNVTLALVNGSVTVTPSDIDGGTYDVCGTFTLSVSPNVFTCSQIGQHNVTLTATDANGNSSSAAAVVTVTGSTPVVSTQVIKSNNTFTGLNANTIALGYGAQSVTLKATDATPGNTTTYAWTPAAGLTNTNTASAVFTPTSAGTYVFTVTATSGSGCTAVTTVTVKVIDVRCGNNGDKVIVCQIPSGKITNPQTICIAPEAVAAHLVKGSTLGSCAVPTTARGSETITSSSAVVTKEELLNDGTFKLVATPNPTNGLFNARLYNAAKGKARVEVIGLNGNVIEVRSAEVSTGITTVTFDLSGKAQGMYKVRAVASDGKITVTTVLIQR